MAKHKRVPLRVDFFDAASGALKSETRQVDERWFARLANKAIAEGHNVVVPGADGKSLTAFAQEPGRRRQMFRHYGTVKQSGEDVKRFPWEPETE